MGKAVGFGGQTIFALTLNGVASLLQKRPLLFIFMASSVTGKVLPTLMFSVHYLLFGVWRRIWTWIFLNSCYISKTLLSSANIRMIFNWTSICHGEELLYPMSISSSGWRNYSLHCCCFLVYGASKGELYWTKGLYMGDGPDVGCTDFCSFIRIFMNCFKMSYWFMDFEWMFQMVRILLLPISMLPFFDSIV